MPAGAGGSQAPLLCARSSDSCLQSPPAPSSSRWRPMPHTPPMMVLSQAEKKKEKSPQSSCLRGQRLLERGAGLFFPGSEQGGKGGHSTRGGPGRRAGCARSRPFPSLSGKGGHGEGGAGEVGGLRRRMGGCVSPTSGEQLIPSANGQPLSSPLGTQPRWLNCAHLAYGNRTARHPNHPRAARGARTKPRFSKPGDPQNPHEAKKPLEHPWP